MTDNTTTPRVCNLRDYPKLRQAFAKDAKAEIEARDGRKVILIDRRSRWGNPIKIGGDLDRADAVHLYRHLLHRRIRQGRVPLEELAGLADKHLACWCHPHACHGDVLRSAAIWAAKELAKKQAS